MSYILDALKKAERDRDLGHVPTLATEHPQPETRRRVWPWIVAAGLVLNAGILLVLLGPQRQAATTAVSSVPPEPSPPAIQPSAPRRPVNEPRPATPSRERPGRAPVAGAEAQPPPVVARRQPVAPAPSATETRSPRRTPTAATTTSASRPTGPEARAASPAAGVTTASPPVPSAPPRASITAPPAQAAAPPMPGPAPLPEAPAPPTRAAAPPTPAPTPPAPVRVRAAPLDKPAAVPPAATTQIASEIPAGAPAVRLDVHVYSERPEERFVFINGRKYLEGQTIDGTLTLQTITRDGAVLAYQGQRFLLK